MEESDMKVSLIDYTGAGSADPENYAASVLVFTKSTRLQMSAGLFQTCLETPMEVKRQQLEYMANTIPSSWEFVSYTFMIEGVTRAFTHQFVRTRNVSHAQQTMRVLDVGGFDYATGPTVAEDQYRKDLYDEEMSRIRKVYNLLIKNGAKIEDARGVLPTNILTNIVSQMNMRTFVETSQKRASPRTQGEYRDVLSAMKEQVVRVHPFISLFMDRTFSKAASDLDRKIAALPISEEERTNLTKLVDQMRTK